MDNQNYYNYYIDTLTNSFTDAIMRNISLQASVKLGEDAIKEYETNLEMLDAEIGRLREEITNLQNSKADYENTKHQVQHIDTFRNELIQTRKENEDLRNHYESEIKTLNDKIDYLQLTPAKRKKIDSLNVSTDEINNKDSIRDGGSF